MWSACRILQYPVGGGHMSAHKDYILKSVSKINFNNMFYQLILLITEKGTDFFEGGAYISKDNKLIDIEKNTLRGDIMPNGSKNCDTCQYLKKRWQASQNLTKD